MNTSLKSLLILASLFALSWAAAGPNTPPSAVPGGGTPTVTSPASTGTVTVTFTPSVPPGNQYVVEQKQLSGSWNQVSSGPRSPISFKITANPGTYTYRVRAKNGSILGPPSNEDSITVPGAPGNLNATYTTP